MEDAVEDVEKRGIVYLFVMGVRENVKWRYTHLNDGYKVYN